MKRGWCRSFALVASGLSQPSSVILRIVPSRPYLNYIETFYPGHPIDLIAYHSSIVTRVSLPLPSPGTPSHPSDRRLRGRAAGHEIVDPELLHVRLGDGPHIALARDAGGRRPRLGRSGPRSDRGLVWEDRARGAGGGRGGGRGGGGGRAIGEGR